MCLILAGACGLGGCKVDRGSQHSSMVDSQTSSAPVQMARTSAPEASGPDAAVTSTPAINRAGGGGGGRADARPVLACFGDSLTAGYGAEAGQSYPDFLQQELDRRGYRYRVVNEGISGNTTKDGLDRLDRVIALKPAVVVVEFGGNDGLRGIRIEDSRSNLDAIVARLQGVGVKVALAGITLPPDYGADYIRRFDQTYALLAAKYHTRMIPFLLKDVFGIPGMMQEDRIHATAKGNQVVAENVAALVLPLLRK